MFQAKAEPPKIEDDEARMNVVLWKKGRKKKPDPTLFVNSVYHLVHRTHNGSFKDAAADVKGISPRMLMKLASVAEIVSSSQKISDFLKDRKIGLDVLSDLAAIKDPEKIETVAEVIAGLKHAHDQRQVVRFAKRCPEASYEQFKDRVLTSKDTKEIIYMALLPLTEGEYGKLKEASKKRGISWDALCMKVIKDWLDKEGK